MTAQAHDIVTAASRRGALIPGRSGSASATSTGSCSAASTTESRTICSPTRCASTPAAGKDHGPVAPRRVRGHRAAGPGPSWCWLTRDGMTATGLGFPAGRPALARLAHIRAVLAARLWLPPAGREDGRAWWHSERRLRAAEPRRPPRARPGRRDPLAQHRGQPVRGAGLGDRGRAHAQADHPDHRDHDRAADPDAVRRGGVPDRPGRPPGGPAGRGLAAVRGAGQGRGPGPARRRVPRAISELEARRRLD